MWRPLTRTSSLLDGPAAGTPSTRSREARRRGGPPTRPKPWHGSTSTHLGTRKWTQRKARTIQRQKRRLKLETPKLRWGPNMDSEGPRIIPGLCSLQLTVCNQERNSRKPVYRRRPSRTVFLPRLVINYVM